MAATAATATAATAAVAAVATTGSVRRAWSAAPRSRAAPCPKLMASASRLTTSRLATSGPSEHDGTDKVAPSRAEQGSAISGGTMESTREARGVRCGSDKTGSGDGTPPAGMPGAVAEGPPAKGGSVSRLSARTSGVGGAEVPRRCVCVSPVPAIWWAAAPVSPAPPPSRDVLTRTMSIPLAAAHASTPALALEDSAPSIVAPSAGREPSCCMASSHSMLVPLCRFAPPSAFTTRLGGDMMLSKVRARRSCCFGVACLISTSICFDPVGKTFCFDPLPGVSADRSTTAQAAASVDVMVLAPASLAASILSSRWESAVICSATALSNTETPRSVD